MVTTRSQSQNANSAANRVLSTPELLEQILLSLVPLSAQTVYLSRRTNTFFHGTIHNSIYLRRALFLQNDQRHPYIQYESALRVNPIFDVTNKPGMEKYIEVFRFPVEYLRDVGFDPGSWVPWSEGMDVWCEDCILELREGPLFEMVLMEKRDGSDLRFEVGMYFRLRRGGGTLPEAVRVPVDCGGWEKITVGEMVGKARGKLRQWYPEVYGEPKGGRVQELEGFMLLPDA